MIASCRLSSSTSSLCGKHEKEVFINARRHERVDKKMQKDDDKVYIIYYSCDFNLML